MSDNSGNKQRLLIVDDSKVIRVTARKILQNRFQTVEAVDGNNAWDILTSQEPFSLIISDLTMPNLDGFGLLEKIRSSNEPHIRNIPVIIITGANDSEATMQRASAAGATDFIGKPFDSVHLLARTEAHAGAYATNNALTEENILLEDQALADPLTGLANDTAFMEQGCALLAYAIRHDSTLALASLEIDNFDVIVKTHDAEAGELVIKSVASALAANIRKEDLAARTGAARFALLLPGMNVSGVGKLSERITADIGKHAVISAGKRVRFTVSIGIAAPEIRADTGFDELLAAAGESLKQAVAKGGNRVVPPTSPQRTAEHPAGASDTEWTLEPMEQKASFEASEPEADIATLEELQVEAVEALPGIEVDAAMDSEIITLTATPEIEEATDAATFAGTTVADAAIEEEEEETIVITSPYSLYDLDEVELAGGVHGHEADVETASETAVASTPAPAPAPAPAETERPAAASETVEDNDLDFLEPRPGLIRRLLGALFGRRSD